VKITMDRFAVDVLVDREAIPAADLRDALSLAVGVPGSRVSLITDVEEYPGKEQADVVCLVSSVSGQFPTLLSIDGRRPDGAEDVLLLVERFAGALQAVCLVGTEDPNPFAMWRVEEGPPRQRVFLVPEAMERGEYDLDGRCPG
jgi:hypothetical protein